MKTINISLPIQLKKQAQRLVEDGFYASFSDLTRDALRKLIKSRVYDYWAGAAEEEHQAGKGLVLNSKKDIKNYLEDLTEE